MTTEATILQEIKKLRNDIATLRQQAKKEERWVSAIWIQELTGWSAKKLENARKQNIITWRKKGARSVEYLLGSVPEVLIKKVA